jgi:hypothetical protein
MFLLYCPQLKRSLAVIYTVTQGGLSGVKSSHCTFTSNIQGEKKSRTPCISKYCTLCQHLEHSSLKGEDHWIDYKSR